VVKGSLAGREVLLAPLPDLERPGAIADWGSSACQRAAKETGGRPNSRHASDFRLHHFSHPYEDFLFRAESSSSVCCATPSFLISTA
jgi:hypothetical protein